MAKKKEVTMNRRDEEDRRAASERRNQEVSMPEERRDEGRRKVKRRRQIDPTTCERDYSDDEIEFMQALDDYKRRSGRMFPTCSEILEVIRDLGYCRPSDDPERKAENSGKHSFTGDKADPAEMEQDSEVMC